MQLTNDNCPFCSYKSVIKDESYKEYYQFQDNTLCPHKFDKGYVEYVKRKYTKKEYELNELSELISELELYLK